MYYRRKLLEPFHIMISITPAIIYFNNNIFLSVVILSNINTVRYLIQFNRIELNWIIKYKNCTVSYKASIINNLFQVSFVSDLQKVLKTIKLCFTPVNMSSIFDYRSEIFASDLHQSLQDMFFSNVIIFLIPFNIIVSNILYYIATCHMRQVK